MPTPPSTQLTHLHIAEGSEIIIRVSPSAQSLSLVVQDNHGYTTHKVVLYTETPERFTQLLESLQKIAGRGLGFDLEGRIPS